MPAHTLTHAIRATQFVLLVIRQHWSVRRYNVRTLRSCNYLSKQTTSKQTTNTGSVLIHALNITVSSCTNVSFLVPYCNAIVKADNGTCTEEDSIARTATYRAFVLLCMYVLYYCVYVESRSSTIKEIDIDHILRYTYIYRRRSVASIAIAAHRT